ncbi:Uncharacterized protein LSUE1_G008520, partial [Lachnellula suecica]
MASVNKSYLDLINDCDSFPYPETWGPQTNHYAAFYRFLLPRDERPHGFLLAETVRKMPWTADFTINHQAREVRFTSSTQENCTAALTSLIQAAIDQDTFKIIHGQHSEPYPIIGAKKSSPVSLERFAAPLFGSISRGAHLTAYTNTPTGLKIWVPRRSPKLFTYPNCLDTTVAGGVTAGEGPPRSAEEASLPEQLVRENAKAVGCLSYISHKDGGGVKGEGEKGLFSPELIYVYDLELPADVLCRQCDDEVKEFYLMDVES